MLAVIGANPFSQPQASHKKTPGGFTAIHLRGWSGASAVRPIDGEVPAYPTSSNDVRQALMRTRRGVGMLNGLPSEIKRAYRKSRLAST